MKTSCYSRRVCFLSALVFLAVPMEVLAQGSLMPPGPPLSSMKTLDQVEPRTPISSVPFTIAAPGSYYLTGNLETTAAGNAVVIVSSDVTLDLGGFTIRQGAGLASGHGIVVGDGQTSIVIRNGTVRGFAFSGVDGRGADRSRIEGVIAINNGSAGILGSIDCAIVDCQVYDSGGVGIGLEESTSASGSPPGLIQRCITNNNGSHGISTGAATRVADCISRDNAEIGIIVGPGSVITNSISAGNGVRGIHLGGDGCLLSGSTSEGNTGHGVAVFGGGSSISDCVVTSNTENGIYVNQGGATIRNCTARFNGSHGIEVGFDCLVIGNNCTTNGTILATGAGIHVTAAGNRIEGNFAILNQQGFWIEGPVNFIIRNTARYNPNDTTPANYVIGATNAYGPIVSVSGIGDIGAAGAPANANHPWANFVY